MKPVGYLRILDFVLFSAAGWFVTAIFSISLFLSLYWYLTVYRDRVRMIIHEQSDKE